MLKLEYSFKQKKRASTLLSLALEEQAAAEALVEEELFRGAAVHMYLTCFYTAQALLVRHITQNPSHKNVQTQLHRHYGKSKVLPRRYVDLHAFLFKWRNKFSYRVPYSPPPAQLVRKLRVLEAYVKFAFRAVPTVQTIDLLKDIFGDKPAAIKDFSYDIYCPKTYSHHVRLTLWQPPFYLDIFSHEQLQKHALRMLRSLRVKRSGDYVVGLNSKLDQYAGNQLIMLDIDSVDPTVESELSDIGGVLLKSGRGYHFIGNTVIEGQLKWEKYMRKLRRQKNLRDYLDRKHIDISLKRGYATLRITTSPVKPQVPVFYKEI